MATGDTRRTADRRPAALFSSASLLNLGLRLGALAVVDAFAVWFFIQLLADQEYILALFVALVTLFVNVAFLVPGMYPYRWLSPGTGLLAIMIVYPTIFTLYVAFTNYKTGNLLTQAQAQDVLEDATYLPENAIAYSWTAFRSTDDPNRYGLFLIPNDPTTGEPVFATPGSVQTLGELGEEGTIELDEDGIPTSIPGWERLPRNKILAILDSVLAKQQFGEPGALFQLNPKNPIREAGRFAQKYTFRDDGTMLDNETGVVYKPIEGTYTPVEGPYVNDRGQVTDAEGRVLPVIRPGYYVTVGLDNFKRLLTNDKIRGPFLRVFLWTIAHAFLTVFLTFSFGLFLALVLNARFMPGRAALRTLLLVPYAIPAFISVLIWRGLLNEQLGIVNKTLESIGIGGIHWTSSPLWVKVGILLVQLWLGFPYMMLITTGALQSIPGDIYEAARVDGANVVQQFRHLTLPLLLVAVGPLLIASFAFNFNNFTIVELFNEGGPPISPDQPAGHSDILITYTYALAFGSGRGADYGFASTITIVIFLMVATITVLNFRFTQSWEEISENV